MKSATIRYLVGSILLLLLLAPAASARKHDCKLQSQRKRTLRLLKEASFFGLFRDLRGHTKFEASDVIRVRGKYYVVFDSSYAVGVVDDRFQFQDPVNQLVGGSLGLMGESQFEGIAWVPENDTLLLMQEAIDAGSHYHPYIYQVKLATNDTDYEVLERCVVHLEFRDDSKGLEGMQYLLNSKGAYLLGLCEGNFCSTGKEGRVPGNGRIVVFKKQGSGEGCSWEVIKVLEIPKTAYFQDYSAMALNYYTGKIAITSQENSTVWIGDFDMEAVDFKKHSKGKVAYLPRNNHCEMIYCNIEGVQWIDNERVIMVSDKSKIRKQPFVCDEKDQSVHIFALPGSMFERAPADEDEVADEDAVADE